MAVYSQLRHAERIKLQSNVIKSVKKLYSISDALFVLNTVNVFKYLSCYLLLCLISLQWTLILHAQALTKWESRVYFAV
jgi:hypothetical protein